MGIGAKIGLSALFIVMGALADGVYKDLNHLQQSHWLTGLACVGVIYLWVSGGGPGVRGVAAARNALLAEHSLSLTELVPENGFTRRIAEQLITTIEKSRTRSDAAAFFNGQPRLMQLNLIAMALTELGLAPLLAGEEWGHVKNPFVVEKGAKEAVIGVAGMLQKKHGVAITIANRQFRIEDGLLVDLSEQRGYRAGRT